MLLWTPFMNIAENAVQSILLEKNRTVRQKKSVNSLRLKMMADVVAVAVPDMTDAVTTADVTDVPAVLQLADALMRWTEEVVLTDAS